MGLGRTVQLAPELRKLVEISARFIGQGGSLHKVAKLHKQRFNIGVNNLIPQRAAKSAGALQFPDASGN